LRAETLRGGELEGEAFDVVPLCAAVVQGEERLLPDVPCLGQRAFAQATGAPLTAGQGGGESEAPRRAARQGACQFAGEAVEGRQQLMGLAHRFREGQGAAQRFGEAEGEKRGAPRT